jgi:hypothetical protein
MSIGLSAAARPRPVKILVDPRSLVLQHAVQGIGDHASIDDHPDPAAGSKQGIQIVSNHDHGEPQLGMKVQQ